MRQALWICLVIIICAVTSAAAHTWHVNTEGTGDAPTIQAGIDSAVAGDTVLVAPGTYTWTDQGTGDELGLIRMKSGVVITSETGEADCATLDAEDQGRILYCSGVDETALIRGFTIINGHVPDNLGGAVYLADSSPGLTNLQFVDNNCGYDGGVISCGGCNSVITGCTFTRGGAAWGGAINATTSRLTLIDCAFYDNQCIAKGGAICTGWSPMTLSGCTFAGNSAGWGGAIAYRSAWGVTERDEYTGCTFVDNHASEDGAALWCEQYTRARLYNCIMAYNTGSKPVGRDYDISTARFYCSDIYGNEGGDWVGFIADQVDTNGNFSACPSFCYAGSRDFHLCDESPCAPGNHPAAYECGLIGAWETGCACGPTALTPTSWGMIKAVYR
jgi:hypothetical protein